MYSKKSLTDLNNIKMLNPHFVTILVRNTGFNIKAASLRLGNFSLEEIETLYYEHTKETGQRFEEGVFPLVWEFTEGQPWLVNALAYEVCFEMEEGRNRGAVISSDMFVRAKENLILRQDTHLDQLIDKLKEDRVRRVLGPILAGNITVENLPGNDVEYVEALGLISQNPQLRIANPIYREIIPRALIHMTQITIPHEASWYIDGDGKLNMDKLLTAFQDFFRKHFEHWVDGFDYAEAGAQLLLQAFLQRIINGGGRVEREYGLGRQRTDLLIIWPYPGGVQEVVIEMKILYGSLENTIANGLEQTWAYMDKCGTSEGYLLIFNREGGIPWEEKILTMERTFRQMKIGIYGL